MTDLGSESSTIREALKPWVKIMCFDVTRAIAAPLQKALSEKKGELERQLAAIRSPVNPTDPEYLRTTAAMREIETYLTQGFAKINQSPDLDDYPDRLLQLLENVPAIVDEETLASVRAKGHRFASAMLALREQLRLDDPESWFVEIDEHRKRH